MTEELVLGASLHEGTVRISVSAVHESPKAEASIPFRELSEILGLWRRWRRVGVGSDQIDEISKALSHFLLPPDVAGSIQSAASITRQRGNDLRLRVLCRDPELSEIPWELLRLRPDSPSAPLDGFLALQPRVHLLRTLGGDRLRNDFQPTRDAQELRILSVTADPATPRYPRLAWLDAEVRAVHSAFGKRASSPVVLRSLSDAVPAVLERALREFRPHVVHLACHGQAKPGGGYLVLQGAVSQSDSVVRGSVLRDWILAAGSRLVVLAACETAGTHDSVAEELVQGGVPSVFAMSAQMGDVFQPQLARSFFGAIADGASIEQAATEARQSLAGTAGAWAIPALYSVEPGHIPCPSGTRGGALRNPGNLPKPSGHLIGRGRETAMVKQLLSYGRLVTVTGPGGVGKSRFAVDVAQRLVSEFADGAWLIDCSACSSRDDVRAAVACALSVPHGADPLAADLGEVLGGYRRLLVLDCLEGLVAAGAASAVTDLLGYPGISVLVTSRARLGSTMEQVVDLEPLDFREGGTASELFCAVAGINVDRLPETSRAAISEVCEILEGMPLAIVLASERLQILDLFQLLALLRQSRIGTLGGADGGLSSAIGRSLQLLPQQDQYRLWELCVFSGGFTWEDALQVFPGNRFDMLDGLMRLTHGSLLQPVGEFGNKRFRLLDSVREYMATVIQDQPNSLARLEARHRHASLFSERARLISDLMLEGKWEEGFAILWPNRSNFRDALAVSVEHRRWEQVESLVEGLARTYMEAGLWEDFDSLVKAGHEAARYLDRPELSTRILGLEGAMEFRRGRPDAGRASWTRRADMCQDTGDVEGAVDAMVDLAVQAIQDGQFEQGLATLDRSEALLGGREALELRATIAVLRAKTFAQAGKYECALEWARQAEVISRHMADCDPGLYVLINLGRVWKRCGMLRNAEEAFTTAIQKAYGRQRLTQSAVAASELATLCEEKGRIQLAFLCGYAAKRLASRAAPRRRQEMDSRFQALRKRFPSQLLPEVNGNDEIVAEILARSETSSDQGGC